MGSKTKTAIKYLFKFIILAHVFMYGFNLLSLHLGNYNCNNIYYKPKKSKSDLAYFKEFCDGPQEKQDE